MKNHTIFSLKAILLLIILLSGCFGGGSVTTVPSPLNELVDPEDQIEPQNTYYIRATATGNNDGSDWKNAFNKIPDSLLRNATYYIADGHYTPSAFDAAASGKKYIGYPCRSWH